MFAGSYTALVTPFKAEKIDWESFARIIGRQIEAGTHGLVPAGTTGESPTLDHDEHNAVIDFCVRAAKGRAKVIAGTGSNSTAEAVMMTRHAAKAGADAALVVVPYYNKPGQEGLYRHFKAIHDATDIPIMLYNVPGRTVADLKNETVLRLAELPRIIGIKDATGDLARPVEIANKAKRDFVQFSGEDDLALAFMELASRPQDNSHKSGGRKDASLMNECHVYPGNNESHFRDMTLGGKGCISVTSNVAPRECAEMHNAWMKGDKARARAIQERLMPLHKIMFCETSPGPVKYACSLLGLCAEDLRLPLIPPAEENKARIRRTMEEAGLL